MVVSSFFVESGLFLSISLEERMSSLPTQIKTLSVVVTLRLQEFEIPGTLIP